MEWLKIFILMLICDTRLFVAFERQQFHDVQPQGSWIQSGQLVDSDESFNKAGLVVSKKGKSPMLEGCRLWFWK